MPQEAEISVSRRRVWGRRNNYQIQPLMFCQCLEEKDPNKIIQNHPLHVLGNTRRDLPQQRPCQQSLVSSAFRSGIHVQKPEMPSEHSLIEQQPKDNIAVGLFQHVHYQSVTYPQVVILLRIIWIDFVCRRSCWALLRAHLPGCSAKLQQSTLPRPDNNWYKVLYYSACGG